MSEEFIVSFVMPLCCFRIVKKTNRESKQPCNGTVFSILKEIIQTAVKYLARIVKVARYIIQGVEKS